MAWGGGVFTLHFVLDTRFSRTRVDICGLYLDHILLCLLRCLAVVHRRHRSPLHHGLCGSGRQCSRQTSCLVRPHLGISARLQKIRLWFGKILVQAEIMMADAIYKRACGFSPHALYGLLFVFLYCFSQITFIYL